MNDVDVLWISLTVTMLTDIKVPIYIKKGDEWFTQYKSLSQLNTKKTLFEITDFYSIYDELL